MRRRRIYLSKKRPERKRAEFHLLDNWIPTKHELKLYDILSRSVPCSRFDDIPRLPWPSYRRLTLTRPRPRPRPRFPPYGFLDLPGEIRNKIYLFVLIYSRPFTVKLQFGGSNTTALLRTNKQIYNEASSIFYGENTFCFPQSLFVGAPIFPQLENFYHLSEQRLQTMTSFIFHITVSKDLKDFPPLKG